MCADRLLQELRGAPWLLVGDEQRFAHEIERTVHIVVRELAPRFQPLHEPLRVAGRAGALLPDAERDRLCRIQRNGAFQAFVDCTRVAFTAF
jgi:hypothetical protein